MHNTLECLRAAHYGKSHACLLGLANAGPKNRVKKADIREGELGTWNLESNVGNLQLKVAKCHFNVSASIDEVAGAGPQLGLCSPLPGWVGSYDGCRCRTAGGGRGVSAQRVCGVFC